jgi:DNA-binding MarR family transcriptional regulator
MDTVDRTPLEREIGQTRPFRSRAQEATVAILRTADVVRRCVATVTEPAGITPQQYNVLRILRGAYPEPLPTLVIGERLIERTPGITRLLDRLAAKGLVERRRSHDDRRLVHCTVTAAGLGLLDSLEAAMDAVDDRLDAVLRPGEIATLLELLARVRAELGPPAG